MSGLDRPNTTRHRLWFFGSSQELYKPLYCLYYMSSQELYVTPLLYVKSEAAISTPLLVDPSEIRVDTPWQILPTSQRDSQSFVDGR